MGDEVCVCGGGGGGGVNICIYRDKFSQHYFEECNPMSVGNICSIGVSLSRI